LERPWTLVTDDSATAEQLAPFEALGTCRIQVAERVRADLASAAAGQ
jgi:hypothetical protein